MRVLVIGSGGREHALVWKIAQSRLVDTIYCIPGNAGIAKLAQCIQLPLDDIRSLAKFASDQRVDLTVVGPEAPLVDGIVDAFNERGLRIFGPTRLAAELEGSKSFCKTLLRKYGIPIPNFRVFTNPKAALSFVRSASLPIVIKADGLAAGKGTVICKTESEVIVTIEGMMEKRIFGSAGEKILVEEFLTGVEVSIIAITDGNNLVVFENSQDYKRVYDQDKGPNTGGMGAYSPAPVVEAHEYDRVIRDVLVPIVYAMRREGRPFVGTLYAGIMFTKTGPRVLEFNVRFGDPETQPLFVRLKSDIVGLLLAALDGKLGDAEIEWDPQFAICVVMASGGYPGHYKTGYPIQGLDQAERLPNITIFHAGTAISEGKLVTAGGRVLGVTAMGPTPSIAYQNAYNAVGKITFKDVHYRKDIGHVLLDLPV
jgi:phosphoribosylamine--glycine ligase